MLGKVGQRWVGPGRRAVKVKAIIVLGSIPGGSPGGSAKPLSLEGVVPVPIKGCLALRVFRLSPETHWKEELI